MEIRLPPGIEDLPLHRSKLEAACRFGAEQSDVVGMAVAGSFATGRADVYSDVDLRIYTEDGALDSVTARREEFARACGRVVAHFTGEHAGLPDLAIVLYEDLVHVDFHFLPAGTMGEHNAGLACHVLWERDGRISSQLPGEYRPEVAAGLSSMEARMWTWCWYIQAKVLRGELYEAIDSLDYVRLHVLFKLLGWHRGVRPVGARRAEALMGEHATAFGATVPRLDRESVLQALRSTMELYRTLADPLLERQGVARADEARAVVLAALESGLDWRPPKG